MIAYDIEIVSILTQPVGRVQQSYGLTNYLGEGVSILTQPVGRVQLGTRPVCQRRNKCFNPHPTRRPGATRVDARVIHFKARFQSSPNP